MERAQPPASLEDRFEAGKELRRQVPRSAHAGWSPRPDRADPVGLLQATDKECLPYLLPIRYGRMLESPFSYLRGATAVMAADMASTPVSGITVQMAGDAHIGNFGMYVTPEHDLVFDVDDFDETLPGPWEWDLKWLATSVAMLGRVNGLESAACSEAVRSAARSYREHMGRFARMSHLDVYYARVDATALRHLASKARDRKGDGAAPASGGARDRLRELRSLCTRAGDRLRIKDRLPLVRHVDDPALGNQAPRLFREYLNSIQPDRRVLIERYRVVDGALKVVGVGSVGTRCFILLLEGSSESDVLFLQMKQALPSLFEPQLGKSVFRNHGERVVSGQRILHAATDIFLGWGETGHAHYYIRRLHDSRDPIDVTELDAEGLPVYAGLCGWALALGHAQSGDAAKISGYLGKRDVFDRAVAAFARDYVDQIERDHAALVAAHREGKVTAELGV